MTHPPVGIAEDQFDEVLARARWLFDRLRDGANRLIDNVNRVLPFLGPWAQRVRDLLARFRDLSSEFFETVGRVFTERGDPDVLRARGSSWRSQVSGPAGPMTSSLAATALAVDNYWEGDAGEAYKDTLPLQQQAVQKIKEIADDLELLLNGVAQTIFAFWLEVIVAFSIAVVEILAAAAAAISVVGAPGAVPAAIAAMVVAVAGFAGAMVIATNSFSGDISLKFIELRQQNLVDAPYVKGAWPRSTVDNPPNDGRDLDEIPTDPARAEWRLKT